MQIRYQYLIFGIIFGLMFPVMGISIDLFIIRHLKLTPFNLKYIYNINVLHYIISLAPFVLGGVFFRVGVLMQNIQEKNKQVNNHNNALNEVISMLDTFNYNVSHDLKSNMFNNKALLGMLEKYFLIGDYQKSAEILEKLKFISAKSISTIVGFIDLAKTEKLLNTKQEEHTICNIKNIFTDVLKELNATDCNYILKENGTCDFKYNKTLVYSVLKNLTSNSLKYFSNERELKINIVITYDKKNALLHFKDNGIGMDLETEKNKLFQPFKRFNNVTNIEGSGIGLYNINKIITSRNGTLQVESEINKGTSFFINFKA